MLETRLMVLYRKRYIVYSRSHETDRNSMLHQWSISMRNIPNFLFYFVPLFSPVGPTQHVSLAESEVRVAGKKKKKKRRAEMACLTPT